MSWDEFEAYRLAAERKVTDLSQQIYEMDQEAQQKGSEYAMELKDREYQNTLLRDKLESKATIPADPMASRASSGTSNARGLPKQPTLHNSRYSQRHDKIQYIYVGLVDRLRQATVETYILRAEMAQTRKDWPAMHLHANQALDLADILNYLPMNARCVFYRGIAQFHMRKFYDATDDFEISRTCIGIYKEEREINYWAREAEKAQAATPANLGNQGWFARFRNSFSKSPSKQASRPESKQPTEPPSRDSVKWRFPGLAMSEEFGSALTSAVFGSNGWPTPSAQEIPQPEFPPEDTGSSTTAQASLSSGMRPASAIERNRSQTNAAEERRPRIIRSATLQVPSFTPRSEPLFDPLEQRDALRQQVAARRPPG